MPMTSRRDEPPVSLWEALLPLAFLIGLLVINVRLFGDEATGGPNQFALILAGIVAGIIGFVKKIGYEEMMDKVRQNIASTSVAIIILLFVGALTGTWLISGIIPTMIYYGLELLNPKFFLASALIISAIVSLTIGSSWSTTATIGVALMGIGKALGLNPAAVAGAVISGAYFGDKLSPLSDTTNLAAAVAGVDLFTHVRYMMYTTIPSITIALILFLVIGIRHDYPDVAQHNALLEAISARFYVHPVLFVVPAGVILLILFRVKPLTALFLGVLGGAVFALIFQKDLLVTLAGGTDRSWTGAYKVIMQAITGDIRIPTDNPLLQKLFSSDGMYGMLGTIWLIISAMFFGGIMEAVGALKRISLALLRAFKGIFGLFFSTDLTCILFNLTASDQYLAIVVPGKMYKQAYEDKGLAPENLSRTLEDSGTVTSVLVPWNTGGAYNSKVLGVPTTDYVFYAFFNLISPLMTLIFAAFRIKIRMKNGAAK
ncbi:MAG: Na+/H+ antiporter NhaC [Chlorobi bacterium]|nr:Na+/H+ antiporter NhaC [Chlorobiota bacterium]